MPKILNEAFVVDARTRITSPAAKVIPLRSTLKASIAGTLISLYKYCLGSSAAPLTATAIRIDTGTAADEFAAVIPVIIVDFALGTVYKSVKVFAAGFDCPKTFIVS